MARVPRLTGTMRAHTTSWQRRGLQHAASAVGIVVLVGGGWEVLRVCGIFDRALMPSAVDMLSAELRLIQTVHYWNALASTLYRALAGLLLAFVVGVPVGLILSSVPWLRPIGIPIVDFFRSIPVTSLYPVVVLTLGIDDRGKIGMIFFGCVLIIALHAAAGFERRSRVRYEVSRLYGASRLQLLYRVSLPEAVPGILTGLRVAAGLALIVGTLTEMFMGAEKGLGQSLMEAYSVYDLPSMFAYLGTLGLLGFAINRGVFSVELKTQPWQAR